MTEYEELLSIEELQRIGFDEDKHVVYYTFAKPDERILKLLPKEKSFLGPHITLSRSFEGICSAEELEKVLTSVASRYKPIPVTCTNIDYFGSDNSIPVIKLDGSGLIKIHSELMSKLLLFGSPYTEQYLYNGYDKVISTPRGLSYAPNPYAPHIKISKETPKNILEQIIGTTFSINEIYSVIKIYGKWDKINSYKLQK
jgi:2'-5' RNA ligase